VAANQPTDKNRVDPVLSSHSPTSLPRDGSLPFSARAFSELQFLAKEVRDFIAASGRGKLRSEEAATHFEQLALKLFRAQYAANPSYQRICDSKGIKPEHVQHWSDIPAVPTTSFKELEVTSLPNALRTTVFHSSGTTEQRPSHHYHSDESLVLYEKSLLSYFRLLLPQAEAFRTLANSTPFAVLSLTPSPAAAPNSSLVHMFAAIRGEFGLRQSAFCGCVDETGWQVDFEKTRLWLETAATKAAPVLVLGSAFSFVHLTDALNTGIRLPSGSVVLETGGYKGRSRFLHREELHQVISQKLGVSRDCIVCEYGMSELSSQAYAFANAPAIREDRRVFRFPAWAKPLVVSPETGREVAEGEAGLLRILDLANVYSVMAIQTEDLAIRRAEGFELMGRAAAAEPRGCSLMSV
jgi:hypothetical protein